MCIRDSRNTESILREHIDKLHRVAKFLYDHEKMSAEEFARQAGSLL